MKYVCLRNTDLKLSRICLGSAGFGEKLDRDQSFAILDAFVRAGGILLTRPMCTANGWKRWETAANRCWGNG